MKHRILTIDLAVLGLGIGFALSAAAAASPALARHVSAAPSQTGSGDTLVYHSSWQTGTLDWTARDMKWSISHGILTLRPQDLGGSLGYGWIVAPYRPSRLENFAVEAVMKVKPSSKPAWGWGGEMRLTAHVGPKGAGVSGRYGIGTDGDGGVIYDATASGGGQGLSTGVNGPAVVHLGRWNTYRLEVRTASNKRADEYSFQINGVQVATATLGDWMQYNRIAVGALSTLVLQVKSINVYRLGR
jgi:hypothetical protein